MLCFPGDDPIGTRRAIVLHFGGGLGLEEAFGFPETVWACVANGSRFAVLLLLLRSLQVFITLVQRQCPPPAESLVPLSTGSCTHKQDRR